MDDCFFIKTIAKYKNSENSVRIETQNHNIRELPLYTLHMHTGFARYGA